MIDPTLIKTEDDLNFAIEAAKCLLSEEEATIVTQALAEAKECLDREDYDGAVAVAHRFGFGEQAQLFIQSLLLAKEENERPADHKD